jgi:predicted DsbA family dithiol-disulfide isomerase
MLKARFSKEKIKYTTIDIEASAKEAKEAGIRGVPTTVISRPNQKDVRIVGFNPEAFKRIKEELNISE